MSISHKHNQSPAKNAEVSTSHKDLYSEKPQDSLQEQAKHPTSPSRSLTAETADTSITNSSQKKLKSWINRFYSGLQDEIYSEK